MLGPTLGLSGPTLGVGVSRIQGAPRLFGSGSPRPRKVCGGTQIARSVVSVFSEPSRGGPGVQSRLRRDGRAPAEHSATRTRRRTCRQRQSFWYYHCLLTLGDRSLARRRSGWTPGRVEASAVGVSAVAQRLDMCKSSCTATTATTAASRAPPPRRHRPPTTAPHADTTTRHGTGTPTTTTPTRHRHATTTTPTTAPRPGHHLVWVPALATSPAVEIDIRST